MIDFREHFAEVSERPGMFELDWRYRSAVSYVAGCNAATGFQLLRGINEWMEEKLGGRPGRGSIAWWGQLVDARFPNLSDSGRSYAELDNQESEVLTADLFAALDEFLSTRESVYRVERVEPATA